MIFDILAIISIVVTMFIIIESNRKYRTMVLDKTVKQICYILNTFILLGQGYALVEFVKRLL